MFSFSLRIQAALDAVPSDEPLHRVLLRAGHHEAVLSYGGVCGVFGLFFGKLRTFLGSTSIFWYVLTCFLGFSLGMFQLPTHWWFGLV